MKQDQKTDLYYSIYKGKEEIIFKEENLPLPYVHAGINYFAFSENEKSEPYICSCHKESILNAIDLFFEYYQYESADAQRKALLSFLKLPKSISKKVNCEKDKILDSIKFKEHICHLCNSITPTTQHSICIYESKLIQQYGHYINTHFLTYGISNHLPDFYGIYFLSSKMPEDFKRILIPSKEDILIDIVNRYNLSDCKIKNIEETLNIIWNLSQEEKNAILYYRTINKDKTIVSYKLVEKLKLDDEDIGYIQNSIHQRFLSVKKIIVDEVKTSFKLKRWVNESVLANIVQELFKNYTIYRNYRPEILEGLELDIYIQELKLGIEYQGIQHIKPVKQWGGEENLKIRKEHDQRKAELCKKNNIELIYFWYDEDINKELVSDKLKNYITNKYT